MPGSEFAEVKKRICSKINDVSKSKIDKIDGRLISDALQKLKPKKSDALFDIVSDMFLQAPAELSNHLARIIRCCLTHGRVPDFLLACQIVPLIKNSFEDHCKSSNYRAIASGCLVLKIIDQVFIMSEEEKLSFDEQQYAYQLNTSTTMCTWAVSNVVEYFNKRGSSVFCTSMDMSKAFDNVSWPKLFQLLDKRSIDPVFLRLIIYIYEHQTCQVKWGNGLSDKFTVKNGVRQGAVSSSIFFVIYIADLLKILRRSEIGCHIKGHF